tara:strand:+ start:394 stop:1563 length:1170 start_codon:yes stop_codon:yes gene_type:complete
MAQNSIFSKDSRFSVSNAVLVLADGSAHQGYGLGALGTSLGELCFNTSMTGYQEIITDPSYTGQIISFTFPHIGNVGANDEDLESNKSFASGIIISSNITLPSNYRALYSLNSWLLSKSVTGIAGVDTRYLTRLIRDQGPQNAVIYHNQSNKFDITKLAHQAREHPSMLNRDLAKKVSSQTPYEWNQSKWQFGDSINKTPKPLFTVVAIDYGAKHNILRSLVSAFCKVIVVPADYSAENILSYNPDGIFLSNGPGDPSATGSYAVPIIKKLISSNIPIFGICLGHQLLAIALGAKTIKMQQGHRGANHPVKDLHTGKVEITSQNHGFVVDRSSLPKNVIETHVSLFDKTVEGIKHKDKPIFSVQFHPEASPGPHDCFYLFQRFTQLMKK